jgi:hypothetical protein
VELDSLHRNARLQDLAEVPADGLAFPVRVGRQQDFRGVLERRLQFLDVRLLVAGTT